MRLPGVVLEIAAGIAIGPAGLGWVRMDAAIQILSQIGLAFLFFLAGLEIDLRRLRGRALRVALAGFALSAALAVLASFALAAAGQIHPLESPLLIAIILIATSLGVVVPVLKDAGHVSSDFGQLVVAASSMAEFGAVVLLSLFFSTAARSEDVNVVLLVAIVLAAIVVALALSRAVRRERVSNIFARLDDTSAQIRVRGAVLILLSFVALATDFGLETVLGAFLAGVIVRSIGGTTTDHQFGAKLDGLAFGFFIPIFFIASGIQFDLDALFSSASVLVRVPIFLAALLLVGGVPALLYRPMVGPRRILVAALLQATSLPFIVAATAIGVELKKISEGTGAALVAAGLLSVVLFPLMAMTFLGRDEPGRDDASLARE